MARRRLINQIFAPFLVIILVALIALSLFATNTLRQFYLRKTSEDLKARATLVGYYLQHEDLLDSPFLQTAVQELGISSGSRITIVNQRGVVLGDSEEDPGVMDNHAGRPEIQEAYQGLEATSTRFSETMQQDMVYLAIPHYKDEKIVAVVRASLPLTFLNQTIWSVQKRIVVSGFSISILAVLVSFFLSRKISKPLERMQKGAALYAAGDFSDELEIVASEEIRSLAATLNKMARQLDERIRTITSQRNEQDAVLSSMKEGVLAVDNERLVIRINPAALEFLKVENPEVHRKSMYRVIDNRMLQEFVLEALDSNALEKTELTISEDPESVLSIVATPLIDAESKQIGTLLVMNDITQLKYLETMRREFVANVSHELKTPITSIKGFVETIQGGLVHDSEKVIQFLSIIERQTNRLNAIIDDLLKLSNIEQRIEKADILFENRRLNPVLREAIEDCQVQAKKSKIDVTLECPADVAAPVNALLLQQAVANLVDNAIKYSNSNSSVKVSCHSGEEITISVQDWGMGIAARHLPRLYERFYRVDKARSRKQGGTGLGLAIVKHITLTHNGRVSVQSSPGEGSTFSIHLPKTRQPVEAIQTQIEL